MQSSYKAAEFFSPSTPSSSQSFDNKISPTILLIIVILIVIFFISGLLHLLVRYLLRTIINTEPEDTDNVTALQGQLQQLFNLHDAGVDQSFIDALPVFFYKAIIGLKDPFDCSVCLCEFEPDDKLRLLPKCSHAFHVECIDTWLLSHSTCPLCRGSLIPDFSPAQSPVLFVLEPGSGSSREIGSSARGDFLQNSSVGIDDELSVNSGNESTLQKALEVASKEANSVGAVTDVSEAKVVSVKLGKFRAVDVGAVEGEGTSSGVSNLDQRRCFSMGSYEYVMDERSSLHVAIKPPKNKPFAVKRPESRVAVSECDCISKRFMFKGFDASKNNIGLSGNSASGLSKKESFSISKIWLRTKKEESGNEASSRRALSSRFPQYRVHNEEPKLKRSGSQETVSEFNVSAWEKSVSELDSDVEAGDCSSSNRTVSRVDERPSFARRTFLWIVGKQKRVGNLS